MSIVKQASAQSRQEVAELVSSKKTILALEKGGNVSIGYIIGETQDKIDALICEYEEQKKTLTPLNPEEVKEGKTAKYDGRELSRLNKITRQFYAKCVAAILLNSYWGIKLLWGLYWRRIYRTGKFTGRDYLNIIAEAKKKAQEAEYSLAMALVMDMTTTWTTMTKKEAEEYRHELSLEREALTLKNSQA